MLNKEEIDYLNARKQSLLAAIALIDRRLKDENQLSIFVFI